MMVAIDMAGLRRTPMIFLAFGVLVTSACLEPNPNALDAGDGEVETSDASAGSSDTNADTGGCTDCDFAMESVEFDVNNSDTITIPKPDMPHTAPIAAVSRYAPAKGATTMGYTLSFSDAGDAYELSIELNGDSGNSRVEGVAVVIGLSDALGAPQIEDLEIPADGCASSSVAASGDTILLDVISSYEPADGDDLSYARTVSGGAPEYCVTRASEGAATLGVRLISFPAPAGATIFTTPDTVLDADNAEDVDYPEVGASSQIAYLIGARAYDEELAEDLGYRADCQPDPPYGCHYDVSEFEDGASVSMGGTLLAVE